MHYSTANFIMLAESKCFPRAVAVNHHHEIQYQKPQTCPSSPPVTSNQPTTRSQPLTPKQATIRYQRKLSSSPHPHSLTPYTQATAPSKSNYCKRRSSPTVDSYQRSTRPETSIQRGPKKMIGCGLADFETRRCPRPPKRTHTPLLGLQ